MTPWEVALIFTAFGLSLACAVEVVFAALLVWATRRLSTAEALEVQIQQQEQRIEGLSDQIVVLRNRKAGQRSRELRQQAEQAETVPAELDGLTQEDIALFR